MKSVIRLLFSCVLVNLVTLGNYQAEQITLDVSEIIPQKTANFFSHKILDTSKDSCAWFLLVDIAKETTAKNKSIINQLPNQLEKQLEKSFLENTKQLKNKNVITLEELKNVIESADNTKILDTGIKDINATFKILFSGIIIEYNAQKGVFLLHIKPAEDLQIIRLEKNVESSSYEAILISKKGTTEPYSITKECFIIIAKLAPKETIGGKIQAILAPMNLLKATLINTEDVAAEFAAQIKIDSLIVVDTKKLFEKPQPEKPLDQRCASLANFVNLTMQELKNLENEEKKFQEENKIWPVSSLPLKDFEYQKIPIHGQTYYVTKFLDHVRAWLHNFKKNLDPNFLLPHEHELQNIDFSSSQNFSEIIALLARIRQTMAGDEIITLPANIEESIPSFKINILNQLHVIESSFLMRQILYCSCEDLYKEIDTIEKNQPVSVYKNVLLTLMKRFSEAVLTIPFKVDSSEINKNLNALTLALKTNNFEKATEKLSKLIIRPAFSPQESVGDYLVSLRDLYGPAKPAPTAMKQTKREEFQAFLSEHPWIAKIASYSWGRKIIRRLWSLFKAKNQAAIS